MTALIAVAYLVGSIPTGVIVAKLMGGPDPRTAGSGNIGATNVGRTAGKSAGIITLIGDVLKGFVITFAALQFFKDSAGIKPHLLVSLAGIAAFIGHLFPVFLKFRGGKGVATVLGIFLAVTPLQALMALAVFIIMAAVSRYVSVASMIAAAMLPVFVFLFEADKQYAGLAVATGILIILKHTDNIKRLMQGTENKIGGRKTPKNSV